MVKQMSYTHGGVFSTQISCPSFLATFQRHQLQNQTKSRDDKKLSPHSNSSTQDSAEALTGHLHHLKMYVKSCGPRTRGHTAKSPQQNYSMPYQIFHVYKKY